MPVSLLPPTPADTRMRELDALIAAAPKRTRRDACREYWRAQVHSAVLQGKAHERLHSESEGRYERFLVEQAHKAAGGNE